MSQTAIVILAAGILLACILGALFLILAMVCPCGSRKEQLRPFEEVYIAHRGLFDNTGEAPENSMAAFKKAIDSGYGIEFDVQRSADGRLFIFHDESLKRMTGVEGTATDYTYEELQKLSLGVSGERIPLLEDVLSLVAGRVPLVIEIKVGFDYKLTTVDTANMLQSYEGIYCMECFNPMALYWYRRHEPQILRGQLSMDYSQDRDMRMPQLLGIFLSHLMFNFLSRPDFISYNHKNKRKKGFQFCRKALRAKTAAWTIKSHQELEAARDMFDIFIFDSFIP